MSDPLPLNTTPADDHTRHRCSSHSPEPTSFQVVDPDMTDALIGVVSQQIELLTFDASDTGLIYRLIESFADARDSARLQLVELLGEIGEDATLVLLDGLSNHVNPLVRQGCAKALARFGDPEAIPTLVQALLNDSDPITQSSASGALARMGKAAVPALVQVIGSSQYPDTQKGQAAWALSCLGTDAIELLYTVAESESPDVRCAAVGAIATIAKHQHPPSPSINVLINALNDSATSVRIEAASSLGKLSHYNATAALIPVLQDSDPDVRRTAALALGTLKDPSAMPALQVLQSDPSEIVRPVVKWAIQQLQSVPSTTRFKQRDRDGL